MTTVDGLADWWTTRTKGSGDVLDGVLEFRFDGGGFDMKVIELVPEKRVHWEVVGGPEEWIGTHVEWELSQAEGFTVILFRHEGWRDPVEFMYSCSTKWATFLMSLKSLIETGTGAPDPRDVKIGNWD